MHNGADKLNMPTQVTFARNCFPISARLVLDTLKIVDLRVIKRVESAKIWCVRKLDDSIDGRRLTIRFVRGKRNPTQPGFPLPGAWRRPSSFSSFVLISKRFAPQPQLTIRCQSAAMSEISAANKAGTSSGPKPNRKDMIKNISEQTIIPVGARPCVHDRLSVLCFAIRYQKVGFFNSRFATNPPRNNIMPVIRQNDTGSVLSPGVLDTGEVFLYIVPLAVPITLLHLLQCPCWSQRRRLGASLGNAATADGLALRS